jgi:hypothetical protein
MFNFHAVVLPATTRSATIILIREYAKIISNFYSSINYVTLEESQARTKN